MEDDQIRSLFILFLVGMTAVGILWTVYVMFMAIVYAIISTALFSVGFYVGFKVSTDTLFMFGKYPVTWGGIACFLLMVAGFKYVRLFFEEVSERLPEVFSPLSKKE